MMAENTLTYFARMITGMLLTVLLICAFGSLSVGAQEQSEEPGFSIEEVIVTARRREERLQDTPISGCLSVSGSLLHARRNSVASVDLAM